jgi:hypothetical protein
VSFDRENLLRGAHARVNSVGRRGKDRLIAASRTFGSL